MTTDEVIDVISQHIQETKPDSLEAVKRLDKIISSISEYVNYTRRLMALTDVEKQDFMDTMEGRGLTAEQRKTLDTQPDKRNYYIEMWARSNYFRRCAWLAYLYGEEDHPPAVQ